MNNCVEYIELISARVDGELTESEKQLLEEHLSVCESCSALYDLYNEMTTAVAESCVPAPLSLCDSIMEAVSSAAAPYSTETADEAEDAAETVTGDSEDTTATGTGDSESNSKKRKTIHIILTRFVPVAACVALILLTVPRFINLGRSSSDTKNDSLSFSVQNSGIQGESIPDTAGTAGSNSTASGGVLTGSQFGGTDNGAPSPSRAPAPAPSAESGGGFDELDDSADFDADDAIPVVTESPDDLFDESTFTDSVDDQADVSDDDEDLDDSEVFTSESSPPPFSEDEEEAEEANEFVGPPTIPNVPMPGGEGFGEWDFDFDFDWDGGGFLITGTIYAIIQMDGGLPEIFAMYGLEPIDDVAMYYEIPREYADILIAFVRDLDGVTVTIVDENGGYAVLIYNPSP